MKKEEKKDLIIVHAKKLIEASYSLLPNQLRLIALACTKYHSQHDECAEIAISAKDFIEAYNIQNPQNVYYELKDIVQSIMRHPIYIDGDRATEYSWFTKNTYTKASEDEDGNVGYVTVKFSPDIEPLLYKLNEKFVKIDFDIAKNLSPNSLRFFQWFKHAIDTPLKNKPNENGIVQVSIPIDEIKERLNIQANYKRYSSLKERVIQPVIKEIQVKTPYTISYKPSIVGQGRKYNTITFSIMIEEAKAIKPTRPTLPKRPPAKQGTDLESKWHIECFNLLRQYRTELLAYDKESKLALVDLKKFHKHAICLKYDDIADMLKAEIAARTPAIKLDKPYDLLKFSSALQAQAFEQMTEEDKKLIADIVRALGDFKLTFEERNIASKIDMREIVEKVTKNKLEE